MKVLLALVLVLGIEWLYRWSGLTSEPLSVWSLVISLAACGVGMALQEWWDG
jgi:hypothetical protein